MCIVFIHGKYGATQIGLLGCIMAGAVYNPVMGTLWITYWYIVARCVEYVVFFQYFHGL